MKLNWLQHVPFEDLSYIQTWADKQHIATACTRLFAGEPLPAPESIDGLVVMGGPMGIHDHGQHPWLIQEKQFIRQVIELGRPVLGICLGAQLIADVLGANVYPGPEKEIGWYPIERDLNAPDWFPEFLTAFHWHGDTFDLPEGAVRLASSAGCLNQGFVYNDRVIALQFHLETTIPSMDALIENCGHELVKGPYIQMAEQMRDQLQRVAVINSIMDRVLSYLFDPGPQEKDWSSESTPT